MCCAAGLAPLNKLQEEGLAIGCTGLAIKEATCNCCIGEILFLLRDLENLLLYGVGDEEPQNQHRLGLAKAMDPRLSLLVHLGVPVRIKHDDCVRCLKIKTNLRRKDFTLRPPCSRRVVRLRHFVEWMECKHSCWLHSSSHLVLPTQYDPRRMRSQISPGSQRIWQEYTRTLLARRVELKTGTV